VKLKKYISRVVLLVDILVIILAWLIALALLYVVIIKFRLFLK